MSPKPLTPSIHLILTTLSPYPSPPIPLQSFGIDPCFLLFGPASRRPHLKHLTGAAIIAIGVAGAAVVAIEPPAIPATPWHHHHHHYP
jgi:hypothetical protein